MDSSDPFDELDEGRPFVSQKWQFYQRQAQQERDAAEAKQLRKQERSKRRLEKKEEKDKINGR